MEQTLGIDLGTNSIGLALKEDNDITWYGVYTFKKGVGEGKSGEFSLANERTKHRSSRRLYNARRYRKWETLKVLIENNCCPLSIIDLDKWKHYKKGEGRVFPVNDTAFQNWIKLDFNGDGTSDYSSPYQLRRQLITQRLDFNSIENRHKLGRALYHIAQRRGFKSSRKKGANEKVAIYSGSNATKTIGRNKYENLIIEHGSLGAAFAHLEDERIRIRNRYTLRSDYYAEVEKILKIQNLENPKLKKDILKAIFFQRPLRSQKGLVGKCTLEPNKPRCPVSRFEFEEYRAWSFLNNIKYKSQNSNSFQPIPLALKEKIFREKFFFKSKRSFKFKEIRKFIHQNGGYGWELNYSSKMDETSVSSCYVSARLKSVFGEDWKNYHKEVIKEKNNKKKIINYSIEDIWHILFSFEDEEVLKEVLDKTLELNEQQTKELQTLFNKFPIGYANLSLKAIKNILPFLREGIIYSEAVILAKTPEIIGNSVFQSYKMDILEAIQNETQIIRNEKTVLNITNNLIAKYYTLPFEDRFGWNDTSYTLDKTDRDDIHKACEKHFGNKTWKEFEEDKRLRIINKIETKYQEFFHSSNRKYFKLPHLVHHIKQFIADNFEVSDKQLNKIYHPSQIAIYPKKEGQQFLSSPKTAAFKNPMAYKTLYKLRDAINYLIEIGKIDERTRIVVEIARSLNNKNKRWAIDKYQRDREIENKEFAIAIEELIKDSNFSGMVNPESKADNDKFRLWFEQMNRHEEVLEEIHKINKSSLAKKQKDIRKYRLWKEQNCQCLYTGKIIKITDLFDQNKIDFEHTIPRSKSFDNSLANLTICYADYNRNIKKNKLPTELSNYERDFNGFTAIKPRLKKWEQKIDKLYKQIDHWKFKSKIAMEKDSKDYAIRQRHINQMKHDYWKNKLDRFTRKEIPQGFINSQLNDTQLITKYAYHYLRTVFSKVDIQKGSNTAEFRKIYGIQSKDEKKDRSQHSHHAIDATILTLIPPSKKREEILKKAYQYEEKTRGKQYHEKPFPGFSHKMIEEIKDNVLINNREDKDRTLAPAKKFVRNKGRKAYLDKDRQRPKIAKGDSVRGELHQQTHYGKIKIAAKNIDGSLSRNEKGEILYNQIKGEDEMWMVLRKPIEDINLKKDTIIDNHLGKFLKRQLNNGIDQNDLKDFQGNKIRHLRCRVKAARGFMQPENATIVKKQTYTSKKDYKNYIYASTGDNYMFGLYENEKGRKIKSINVLQAIRYSLNKNNETKEDIFKHIEPVKIGRGKNKKEAHLKHIFEVGQKVIFFENEKKELKDLDNEDISKRLYYIKTLTDAKAQRILLQHHLEARSDNELKKDFPKEEFGTKGKDGFSKFSTDFQQPRLLLTPTNFNFIIENVDFNISLDGVIEYKF